MEEKKITSKVSLNEGEKVYTVRPKSCPFAKESGWKEKVACCVYTENENLHVCPYSGEEVKVAGGYEHGLATSYCTYPVVNKDLGYHF